MLKNALEFLFTMGRDAAVNQVHEINGVQFVNDSLDLDAVRMPEPDCLNMTTLSGIVDYAKANRDQLELGKFVIHVESPALVKLCGPLMHATEQRFCYVTAAPLLPQIRLETYLDTEQFNMMLQYGFVETDDRATLLAFTACVVDESRVTTEDNGVNQVVTAKTGIARREDVIVPNPVRLRPYRTFPEIEQPESPFLLRMRNNPVTMGLWAADGGAWRNSAMHSIKAYLAEQLPEMAILA